MSRYHPEKVFSEVIGEHLDATKRFNFFEFPSGEFDQELLDKLFQYCTNPAYYYEELVHNREVIKKRYTRTALINKIELFFECNLAKITIGQGFASPSQESIFYL